MPPTQLNVPLSRSILKGKNVTFDKISFLDSADKDILEKIIKHSLRFTGSILAIVFFLKVTQNVAHCRKHSLRFFNNCKGACNSHCRGVTLQILQFDKIVPCFFILFAAEPEYCAQNIYEKMIDAFYPKLVNEGNFKSEFYAGSRKKIILLIQALPFSKQFIIT